MTPYFLSNLWLCSFPSFPHCHPSNTILVLFGGKLTQSLGLTMSTTRIALLTLLATLLPSTVAFDYPSLAHRGCGGHEMIKRNPGGPVMTPEMERRIRFGKRQAVTSESTAAQSTGKFSAAIESGRKTC